MPREAWVFYLRNAYHQKQKTYIKHSCGLHQGETFYLIVSLLHFHASILLNIFLTLSFSGYIYHQFMLIFFAFDIMTWSHRNVVFFVLLFFIVDFSFKKSCKSSGKFFDGDLRVIKPAWVLNTANQRANSIFVLVRDLSAEHLWKHAKKVSF